MKKSQILAALALAFALGVVAPVAGANAKVVGDDNTTGSVTTAQMNTLNKEMLATDKAFNDLDHAQAYIDLYNYIDNKDNGFIDKTGGLNDILESYVDTYNLQTNINRDNINKAIKTINDNLYGGANLYQRDVDNKYVNLKGTPTTLGQAQLRTLSDLNRNNDFKSIYNSIKALYDNAVENIDILSTNYTMGTGAYTVMYRELSAIVNACDTWLQAVVGSFSSNSAWTDGIINRIQNINPDVAKNLQLSEAWINAANVKAGSTAITAAVRLQLALDAARALPKYSVSGQLAAAQVNYNKINASDQAVDYSEALSYVKAMNTAIANFKAGRVDTPAGDDQNNDDINVRPGNTGVVAGAEGTASTTVSIVAGLATALTALGAGVIVYRNARRSSEN